MTDWRIWLYQSGLMETGVSRCFGVESDDGEIVRIICIGTVSDTGDVAGLLSAVAGYSEREREKALAAIQALEGGCA